MKKIFRHPLISLVTRLLAIYFLLFILRVIFWIYNIATLSPLSFGEYGDLLRGSLLFDTANVCYTFGLFVLWSLLPLSARALKHRWYVVTSWILYMIGVSAVVATNLSDSVYFHFSKKRFTWEEFSTFEGNDNNGSIMWKTALENWYLVVVGGLLIWAMVAVFRATRPESSVRNRALHYGGRTLLMLASVATIIVGMRGGLGRDTRPITLSNAGQYATTPAKASIVLSNPFCMLRTIENKPIVTLRFMSDSLAKSIYTPLHQPTDSLTVASQKGKNVVIFVLESFSAEHSAFLNPDLYPDGSIMPFLDSLMGVGYTFRNAYANGYKSIDALPSLLSSIPSLGIPFATLPAALSPMDGLGKMLGEQGYSTWFYNGSNSGSMGYSAYARLAGITNFRSRENYEASRGDGDYDGFWGIWDEPFLQYFGTELTYAKEPFFASLFTLTTHHPFVIPDKYASDFRSSRTKVHRCVQYTDMAFRRFFEYARHQPWYAHTLFVFIADHVSSESFAPATRTPVGATHITYFMYTPDGSLRGASDVTTQQIDVKPTLLGLLGNEKPYFAFGSDVFDIRNSGSDGFAVNFSGVSFQYIRGSRSFLMSSDGVVSGVSDSTDISHLQAFVQNYYGSLDAKDFSYTGSKVLAE